MELKETAEGEIVLDAFQCDTTQCDVKALANYLCMAFWNNRVETLNID